MLRFGSLRFMFFFLRVDDYIFGFSDMYHVCPNFLTSQVVLKKFNQ